VSSKRGSHDIMDVSREVKMQNPAREKEGDFTE
jgi:hypothetical protein